MNEISMKENNIKSLIYEIRGKQVMLDSDLARLYQVETKQLKRSVRRNIERFPESFMFQLTSKEYYEILRCQFGTLELKQGEYTKYLPYAFTEQGVTMLSGVLHTEVAIDASIKIINAFVEMRHYISSNLLEQKYVNNLVLEHENRLDLLEASFDEFKEKRKSHEIYFNGQIFDAYSKIYIRDI